MLGRVVWSTKYRISGDRRLGKGSYNTAGSGGDSEIHAPNTYISVDKRYEYCPCLNELERFRRNYLQMNLLLYM